ncbi:MAG: hypothetical protein IJ026_07830 [Candidatus Methanomethylophilaceae archaeon]|nr:hypothetical protein [Candidatus Methanomethylophilaceae archaeon]
MELRQDYTELVDRGVPLIDTVPQRHVEKLSRILSSDADHLLAYLTVSLILDGNPGITMERAVRLSLMLEPEVAERIREVASSWET